MYYNNINGYDSGHSNISSAAIIILILLVLIIIIMQCAV